MKILVTGGAGYIGSFMTKMLLDRGFEVVVADSLEKGHKDTVDPRAEMIIGNLCDKKFVENIFSKDSFDAVIHFAAFISMSESMQTPGIYFENNILASLNVIEEMKKRKLNNFIFSSTAGVYGNPQHIPITEDHPKNPENPYGESKLMVEKILSWYGKTVGFNFAVLRYFNAAGASPDGSMGENHNPESHIIPNIMNAILEKIPFTLYGNDYETQDGTCIRDYIHVLDLVEAHILAMNKLQKMPGNYYYNIGTGQGHSNKEVIEMVKKITGIDFQVNISSRRPGDANVLVADNSKSKKELGFEPKYSDLETIVKTAWAWHSKIKNGK